MEICTNNHEEIVYDSNPCPLCEAIDRNNVLEEIISELEQEIKNKNNAEE